MGGGGDHNKGDYGSRCSRGGRCWGLGACNNRGRGGQLGREKGCRSDGAGGVLHVQCGEEFGELLLHAYERAGAVVGGLHLGFVEGLLQVVY